MDLECMLVAMIWSFIHGYAMYWSKYLSWTEYITQTIWYSISIHSTLFRMYFQTTSRKVFHLSHPSRFILWGHSVTPEYFTLHVSLKFICKNIVCVTQSTGDCVLTVETDIHKVRTFCLSYLFLYCNGFVQEALRNSTKIST